MSQLAKKRADRILLAIEDPRMNPQLERGQAKYNNFLQYVLWTNIKKGS
jgi:hypothetical protein